MNLARCYRLLGLDSGAAFDEVKAAYRRLARQYHPDINPQDQAAKEKFIEVTTAYKRLLQSLTTVAATTPTVVKPIAVSTVAQPAAVARSKVARPPVPVRMNPRLSPLEHQFKVNSYQQLQQFLRAQRLPRAIALVEALVRRLPHDAEVLQWQAIVYQQWARHLVQERQFDKARIYLKKALQSDPHNRSLWAEVEQTFRQMEHQI